MPALADRTPTGPTCPARTFDQPRTQPRDTLRWFRWPVAIVAGLLALYPAYWVGGTVSSSGHGALLDHILAVIGIAILICAGVIAATVQLLTPAALRLDRLPGHAVVAFLFGTLIALAPILLLVYVIASWFGVVHH